MSACQFVRLQQVVCIKDAWEHIEQEESPGCTNRSGAPYTGPHPEKDDVCRIMSIVTTPRGSYLVLDGYAPFDKYDCLHFRPLRKGDPDIGDFHAILDLVNAGLVRAC